MCSLQAGQRDLLFSQPGPCPVQFFHDLSLEISSTCHNNLDDYVSVSEETPELHLTTIPYRGNRDTIWARTKNASACLPLRGDGPATLNFTPAVLKCSRNEDLATELLLPLVHRFCFRFPSPPSSDL